MDVLWLLIFVICVALTIILAFLAYSGAFNPVNIQVSAPAISGPWSIAYKYSTGPYRNVGPIFDALCKLVPSDAKLVGIYYDDPKRVPQTQLRWAVGVLLSEDGNDLLDQKYLDALDAYGCKRAHFPVVSRAVTAEFRFGTFLSPVWRVYPSMCRFIETNRLEAHPAIELYLHSRGKIHFLMPLEKQGEMNVIEVED